MKVSKKPGDRQTLKPLDEVRGSLFPRYENWCAAGADNCR